MKALIFAAGVGSRLKPWTDHHPKALVEVGGKPMLGNVIEKMINVGIKDIIVNVHHFANQIAEYIKNAGFDANIMLSDETDLLLETGGGLRNALSLIGKETVLVHNADIFTDFNIREMISVHNERKDNITLLTAERTTSRYFVFDKNEGMCGWTNVSTGLVRPNNLIINDAFKLRAFNGVHIIEPVVYDALKEFRPSGTPFSIVDFYIEYCRKYIIRSFEIPSGSAWFDIGKPDTLEKAREYFETHK